MREWRWRFSPNASRRYSLSGTPPNSELGRNRGLAQFRAVKTKALSLLQELTEAHSVPGHEDEVRAIFVDELSECGDLSTDRNGSVFCECGTDGPRVLVAGHMDEVGFLVQNITPEGFIQFLPVDAGGDDTHQDGPSEHAESLLGRAFPQGAEAVRRIGAAGGKLVARGVRQFPGPAGQGMAGGVGDQIRHILPEVGNILADAREQAGGAAVVKRKVAHG